MKRLILSIACLLLLKNLAFADPSLKAQDIVDRYHAAKDEQTLIQSAKDWQPKAMIKVTIKYGHGQPDDNYSFELSKAGPIALWKHDPQMKKLTEGFEEKKRSNATSKTDKKGDTIEVTSSVDVSYSAQGYQGVMKET